MRKPTHDIKERSVEELRRVFGDHINMAHKCGILSPQACRWWDGEQVPSAVSMRVLDQHGVDIYYIITGKRMVKTDV